MVGPCGGNALRRFALRFYLSLCSFAIKMLGLVALVSIATATAVALPEPSLCTSRTSWCYCCRLLVCGCAAFVLLVADTPRAAILFLLLGALVCGVSSTCGTVQTTIGRFGLVWGIRSRVAMGMSLWNCKHSQSLITTLKFDGYLLSTRDAMRAWGTSLPLCVSLNGGL
jgi:hypothetical protein